MSTADATMPTLLDQLSMVSRAMRPVVVEKPTTDSTAATTPIHSTALRRVRPNFSWKPAATTCRIEMSDVNPAIASEKKNSAPNSWPAGICETTAGNVTNDRIGPVMPSRSATATPCSCARKPSAANTPMPASISKPELENATTRPGDVRFALRFRYDEYVIMMPNATESEKKICPYAAIHTFMSPSADQSGVNRALRPSPAPSRKSARTTSTANAMTSSGRKTTLAFSMPFATPPTRTAMVATHTSSSGMSTAGTKSSVNHAPPLAVSDSCR